MADQFESYGEIEKSAVLEPGVLTPNIETALESARNQQKRQEEHDVLDTVMERADWAQRQSGLRLGRSAQAPSTVVGAMPRDILQLRDVLEPLKARNAMAGDVVPVSFSDGRRGEYKVSELRDVHNQMMRKLVKEYTSAYPTGGEAGAENKVREDIEDYRKMRAAEMRMAGQTIATIRPIEPGEVQ